VIRNIWIIVCLSAIISFSMSAADEVKVKTSGGIQKIAALEQGKQVYYSLSGLSELIGGKVGWERLGYSVKFSLDTNVFIFTVGSPYIRLNTTAHNMMLPAMLAHGELYVPAETFSALLDFAMPERINWDGDGRTLRIDTEWYNITDLSISAKQNGLLIEIFISSPLQYEIYQSEGNWINLNFPDGRINRGKILAAEGGNLVYKINAFQFETSAQISLRLKRQFRKYYTMYRTNPGRLQIAVEDSAYVPDSALTDVGRIGPDEEVDVVVIDPGHGGTDFGAIGRQKRTREKTVNLELANLVAKMIRKDKQFKVVMTRTGDVEVSLDERARIANEAKADMFISIHCNSSGKKTAHGFQVFYLAPAKNDSARAVAQFENAPFLVNDPSIRDREQDDLTLILNDMIQTEFLAESADLAYMADMEMRKKLGIRSRGVDHAGFFVLNRVYMPSILVETAFISNADEESLLKSTGFRDDVAEAIYNAVKRFKSKYEGK